MKFTKTHEKQIRDFIEIADVNGCVALSDWVSGKGKYATTRALPPFVMRFERKEYPACERPQWGTPARTAYNYLNENKRRKGVLVMDKAALADFLFSAAHLVEF